MQRIPAEAIIEALKPLAPHALKVYTIDGQERDVGIPPAKKRYRYHQLQKTLQGFDWYRIEALDAHKRTIGVWENADQQEVEEVPTERAGEQAALLALMLKAQDMALKRHTEHTRELLESAVNLMNVYAERLMALERLAHAQLDRKLQDAEHGRAAAGDGLEEQLLAAVLAKGVGGNEAAMEGMMERVAARVLPRVLSPGPSNGTTPSDAPKGGSPGTEGSKRSKPDS